jgi:hypothetical protein
MNLLIGKKAIEFYTGRKTRTVDYDIISENAVNLKDSLKESVQTDIADVYSLNNYDILDNYKTNNYIELNGQRIYICSLKGLAILYRSHLWRRNKFKNNIYIYHWICDKSYNVNDLRILKARIKATKKHWGVSNPNLNQSNQEFFDDSVDKKFDHDHIHELVSYPDKPMYTRMKRNRSLAKCEKDMWDDFIHMDKIKCVQEETYVIAMERFLIRNDFNWREMSWVGAYHEALEKVCTELTSGWFRDFAIDNFPEISKNYNPNVFTKVGKELGYDI